MKTMRPEKLHFDPATPCCADQTKADLFPSFMNLQMNALNRGRLFSVYLETFGMGALSDRRIEVDSSALSECMKSPHYSRLLELSLAKLALEQAVLRY